MSLIATTEPRTAWCRIRMMDWDGIASEYAALITLGAEPSVAPTAGFEGYWLDWHCWSTVHFPPGALYRLTLS